jgi:hypothetical protein
MLRDVSERLQLVWENDTGVQALIDDLKRLLGVLGARDKSRPIPSIVQDRIDRLSK